MLYDVMSDSSRPVKGLGIGSDSTEPNYRPFFLTVGLSPPPPQ
jgi:hypothetical protein